MKVWREISGSNYEISNNGEVRNKKTGRLIKAYKARNGYLLVSIKLKSGERLTGLIHRLVATAFIQNRDKLPQVNHKDGEKTNNSAENLEWVTPKQNMRHAFEQGLYKKYDNKTYKGKFGKDHNRSICIECEGVIYNGYSEASRLTGVGISTLHAAVKENRPIRDGRIFKLAKISKSI